MTAHNRCTRERLDSGRVGEGTVGWWLWLGVVAYAMVRTMLVVVMGRGGQ